MLTFSVAKAYYFLLLLLGHNKQALIDTGNIASTSGLAAQHTEIGDRSDSKEQCYLLVPLPRREIVRNARPWAIS